MNNGKRLPSGYGMEPENFAIPASDHPQDESPLVIFQRLHRLLRGRYWIALTLAVIGAAAGAIGGWLSTVPKYQSVGSLRIIARLPSKVYDFQEHNANITSLVKTQANLLQDARVINKAMGSTAWQRLGRGNSAAEKEAFERALTVTTDREEPEWIRVKFLDPDPRAAKVAVEEVIMSYAEIWGNELTIVTPELMQELYTIKVQREAEVTTTQQEVQQITNKWFTIDLASLQKDRGLELRQLERQIFERRNQIEQAELRLAGNEGANAAPSQDPIAMAPRIAQNDPYVAKALADYTLAKNHLRALQSEFTDKHTSVRKAKTEADVAKSMLEEAVVGYMQQGGAVMGEAGNFELPASAIEPAKAQLKVFQERKVALESDMRDLTQDANKLAVLLEDLQKKKSLLADVEKRLSIINVETDNDEVTSNRIKIVSKGEEPISPYSDPRKKLAALGIFFGGGTPIALIMLLGLIDGRYRYSDQATDPKRHVTLLGILPYLPGKMHDPEQAAIAAHCVHQIRTLLQIGGQMSDRRVFAITSPTAGDGKTSLALSLGLSFAASGSSTCLIDFDMIGGGLTSGMQAKTESGLMDAIDAGSIDEYVKPTSFPRLSIIPIGRNDSHEVSRLSPVAVREIIQQAKKRFDIVVIDTGPVLGSIEASLACSAADGVILALGRGQQKHYADRAIDHLHSIGARLLGIVFNRAQAGDFKRSVSSASVRSVPALEGARAGSNGHSTRLRAMPALGPMASTVASGIRDDDVNASGSEEQV
jgi:polysaccharide biosynthesis transport protein